MDIRRLLAAIGIVSILSMISISIGFIVKYHPQVFVPIAILAVFAGFVFLAYIFLEISDG